ncbi:MAG TPA: thermonuclease family protein [Microbacteriaceae bacterium]|jgi:endonuclease YncB( thermonuclease family)|nr:thermonuclease family protein [Microbacteriaceae bacterium]
MATPISAVARATAAPQPPTVGVVDHVADGDTFTLRGGNRVRIIGIDAPEEYFGRHDCGSKPAAALLQRLLPPGTRVTVRRDSIQPNRDRYQRLLRYVGRTGVPDVGLAMIRSGWAGADPYGDGNAREGTYAQAARHAKALRVGAWGGCHPLPPAFLHTT